MGDFVIGPESMEELSAERGWVFLCFCTSNYWGIPVALSLYASCSARRDINFLKSLFSLVMKSYLASHPSLRILAILSLPNR